MSSDSRIASEEFFIRCPHCFMFRPGTENFNATLSKRYSRTLLSNVILASFRRLLRSPTYDMSLKHKKL